MANQISHLIQDLENAMSTLEAAEMLLSAQVDANNSGQEELRDHLEGTCNIMLDRAIEQLSDFMIDIRQYRRDER